MSRNFKKITLDTWARLFPFLEEANGLPPDQLDAWLGGLRTEQPDIAEALSKLLSQSDQIDAQQFLEHSYSLPHVADRCNQQIGAYTVTSLLGEGGMGEVWLAQRSDGHFSGNVAVKFLRLHKPGKRTLERFQREGRLLARLAHVNIARLIDAGVSDQGEPYLVLEYVEGKAIDEYCESRSLGIQDRVRLALQVLAGLTHAHGKLIIHRDIKPSNVLVTPEGVVKLLDFGVAKLIGETVDEGTPQATRVEDAALTPDYAAPEQLLGEPQSTATDVYQMGVLLHVLLAGRLPFDWGSSSRAERVRAALDDPRVRPSDALPVHQRHALRGDLDAIVSKALRAGPHERYDTAATLALDLQRYLGFQPISARPDSIWYRTQKFVRRYRAAVFGTTLSVLALLVAAVFSFLQMNEAQKQRDAALFQERRADAQNKFLSQVMSAVGSVNQPLTPAQVLDRGLATLDRQYSSDPAFRIGLLVRMADSFMTLGDVKQAYAVLTKAEALAMPLHDPSLTAAIDCPFVELEIDRGAPDRALARLAQGEAAISELQRPSVDESAHCLYADALLMLSRGEFRSAIEVLQRALDLMQSAGATRDLIFISILARIQDSYSQLGDPVTAFDYAAREIAALQDNGWGDSENELDGQLNLGIAYVNVGEVQTGYAHLAKTVTRIRNGTPDRLVSSAASGALAIAALRMNHLDEALQMVNESITAAQRDEDLLSEIFERGDRARVLIQMGRLPDARASLDKMAELVVRKDGANHRPLIAARLTEISLLRAEGQWNAAQSLSDSTLATFATDSAGGSAHLANAHLEAGRLANDQLHFKDGEDHARIALRLFEKRARKPEWSAYVGEALLVLSTALHGQTHQEESRLTAIRAVTSLSASLGVNHPLTLAALRLQLTDPGISR